MSPPVPSLPPAAWTPTPELVADSNMAWLMQRIGVDAYPALHRWSVEQRDAYWRTAIERLDIPFRRPPQSVLDASRGAAHARWLTGAELNVTESCFRDRTAPAIQEQSGTGSLKTTSVEELDRLSSQFAEAFARDGIQPGDAVALIVPMTSVAVAAYLGVLKCGAAAVGIAESFSAHEIAVRLRLSNARRVLVQARVVRGRQRHDLYSRLCDTAGADGAPSAAFRRPPAIVICDEASPPSLQPGDVDCTTFLSGTRGEFPAVARRPDDPLGILFSSGTTGDPKAIPWSQLCAIKCAADAHFHHDVHPGDVLAWPTSLGWMMGPWLIFASLMNRATMALFDGRPLDAAFPQFVERAQVTMLGVVPALVAAWRSSDALRGCDWRCIKVFSSTGECSNADDMRWLMQQAGGRPVIEYCGGTEIAGGYITGTVVRPCVPATFNTPALGLDIVILDENGQPAERGEVFLRPPSVGLSAELLNADHDAVYYEGCPREPNGECLRRHGDEMEALPDGYWRAHGRVDDTMNLAGIKVSAAEIERAVLQLPEVKEAAAVAEMQEGGGPCRLILYTVLHTSAEDARQPSAADEAAELQRMMQQAVNRELNPLFRVHEVRCVDVLPRTASNKIMRRLLRKGG